MSAGVMHAVVVQVTVHDEDKAEEELKNRVVPEVSKTPGLVAGYWTRLGNRGLSMVVFESEDAARGWAELVPRTRPQGVTLEHVEVRAVIATVKGESQAP
jgi:heme-degrading monooxygenase HmoA